MVTEHCPEAGHSSGLLLLSSPPLHHYRWRGPTSVSTHTGRWYSPTSRHPGPLDDWWSLHSTSRFPTSTGAVHKSVTVSCVFMLVQLNKCFVVRGSDLQRGNSGDGCFSSSNLFKYENSRGHFWFYICFARCSVPPIIFG